MKTHNLFYHASIVLEAEDDLFPGIDSSAFDEHDKQKKQAPKKHATEFDELDSLNDQAEYYTDLAVYHQKEKKHIIAFLQNNNAFEFSKSVPQDIDYRDVSWLKNKYPLAYHEAHGFFASSSSPILGELQKHFAKLNRVLERVRRCRTKLDDIQIQLEM